MRWGVWQCDGKPPHVMPCDDQMHAAGAHIVSDDCWCKPRIQRATRDGTPVEVVVHNDRELGGFDA